MNVSLPNDLKSYVDEQVGDGGYGSTASTSATSSGGTKTVNTSDEC